MNVLSKTKQEQAVALGRLGWSARRIAESTGIHRESVAKYLRAAGVEVRPPGRWGHPPRSARATAALVGDTQVVGDAAEPYLEHDAQSGDPPKLPPKQTSMSLCEPHRAFIEEKVNLGCQATSIWRDLVELKGFGGAYASVMRFVRGLKVTCELPREVIITPPGEEAQVDYGEGPLVRCPKSGRYKRTRLFVMTLGCSRRSVRLLTWRSSSKIWAQLHEESFRRLGGSTRIVVLDNLKEGVIKPDFYDPEFNVLFKAVLAHYGVTAVACKVRDPDRKGKVESGVRHTQDALTGRRFETIEAAQSWLDNWSQRWAQTRVHGTTKRRVDAMFAAEKPYLQALPAEPFVYFEHGMRSLRRTGHIEVKGAYYPVPPHMTGPFAVQWDERRVRVLDPATHALLVEHERVTPGEHVRASRPHRYRPLADLLSETARHGEAVAALCNILARAPEIERARRELRGLMKLAQVHGDAPLNTACSAALEFGVPTYRFVRNYLKHHPGAPISLRQIDPLIRELTNYRDVINQLTGHSS